VRVRRLAAVAALATAVIVPAGSAVAVASVKSPSPFGVQAPHASGKGKNDKPAKPAKPPKPVKVNFTAEGTVTAVDAAAGTVTVAAKGGTTDVRGSSVTIAVPATTRIVVNGARGALADLAAGFRITVTGSRAGTDYTAGKIEARGKRVKPNPSTSPTPAPTGSATPAPTPSDSTAPAPTPTDSATPAPAVTPTPTDTPTA
jgi:hypothetical protein